MAVNITALLSSDQFLQAVGEDVPAKIWLSRQW